MQLIFLTGLPRTGTSWSARTIAEATGSKLANEPFNWKYHPESVDYHMRYLPAGSDDKEFIKIARKAIGPEDRVVLKDVHCCLATEYLWEQLEPLIVIIIRHPCGMASSWAKLKFEVDFRLNLLLNQNRLIKTYLKPFKTHLQSCQDYFFQLGAYWGAGYYVLHQIAAKHPDWQWITHESLCYQPSAGFEKLLNTFGLEMGQNGYTFLHEHNRERQGDESLFYPARVTARQPGKWKQSLSAEQIDLVLKGANAFGVMDIFYANDL